MKQVKLLMLVMVMACNSITENEVGPDLSTGYPADFDYDTTIEGELAISVQDNRGVGMSNIPLQVYSLYEGTKTLLLSGKTAENGTFTSTQPIGIHIDSLLITTTYIGVPHETQLAVADNMNVTIGGEVNYELSGEGSSGRAARTAATNSYNFMGSYDSQGVPFYLEPVDDYVSQDLLDLINTSLPERYAVPVYNPEYIVDSVSSDTQLRDSAEVWVTFVHEGAGWRNTLGYYTYDTNNPPASVDDIDELKIIFPNVSFVGGGGGLESGNKVYLGNFPPNTGIGWFLVPNSWNGSSVTEKSQVKYSNRDFNTYTGEDYRTHTVLLKDDTREILLLGMEDITRPGGDNDFNDAVFYVTSNPFSALVTTTLNETTTNELPDSDGDGVADENDDYPDDADKAFDIFTPGENMFGSIGFEDLYPSKGDFDMNDLVMDYNFQSIANVATGIVELRANFKLKALGAMIHSGYGFTLPVSPDKIERITGQNVVTGEEITLNANGTEANQTNSVILLFEDAFRAWTTAYGRTNTITDNGHVDPMEMSLTIVFSEPISALELGYAPYDPFIFYTEDRSREVHLVNGTPTDLASFDFMSGDDRIGGEYYKTYDNLPYAIHLPVSFTYPEEEQSITDAFVHFEAWAQSLKTAYNDWYMDNTGYRITSKIYTGD